MVLRGPERVILDGETDARTSWSFTVGICATGNPKSIPGLIETIEDERYPAGFDLRRIVVVASDCRGPTLKTLEAAEKEDPRIDLIKEERRRGKASAINEILERSQGDFLVLANADALPARGSIPRLLRAIGRDPDLGMASATPVIQAGRGIAAQVLELMWGTHNACATDLSGTELSNHGSDELMAVRLDAVPPLPPGVVNDGAYMAGRVRQRGLRVRSLEAATVTVHVPTRPIEIIRQRRRILYGHIQVWRLVGRVPATIESLMLTSPGRGFSALVRTVSRKPRLIFSLPFAVVGEAISLVGAMLDTASKSDRHTVWERYAD